MRALSIPLFCASGVVLALLGRVVEAAPVANLPLTCQSASAVGQPQNNCSGLVYVLPSTDQLVVLRAPPYAPTWIRAASLTSGDLLAVCALPVEPGTYSSCRDSAGVRRITYVAKSQVFAAPPPNSNARVLDLSRVPVEINEPGTYVFDRSWVVTSDPIDGAIVISADDVILDLQGFQLTTGELGVRSTGRAVTIRNGVVTARFGGAIRLSGSGSRIEQVRADVGFGRAIELGGTGSILTDSAVSVGDSATAVTAGDDTIVRNSRLESRFIALSASSRTTLVDNEVYCGINDPCIEIQGTENIVRRNTVRETLGNSADGVVIRGDYNLALDNVFLVRCSSAPNLGAAIVVDGRGNTLRDNMAPSCQGFAGWATGMRFLQDGNFYGDNILWAAVPFDIGATVQTDLGGNVGLSN